MREGISAAIVVFPASVIRNCGAPPEPSAQSGTDIAAPAHQGHAARRFHRQPEITLAKPLRQFLTFEGFSSNLVRQPRRNFLNERF
jgi:hypothetical protein